MSASADPGDVLEAYQLGASTYFQKPGSLEELTELLRTINHYWNQAVKPAVPARC